MLRVANVTTFYLRNISFELDNCDAVILGSNGAGKTTLAKHIVGLEGDAEVYCADERIGTMSAKRRSEAVNFVPPKLEIYDEYIDVEEFLALSILNKSTPEDAKRILEELSISHLKKSFCKSISSGESQLVLFASALLHNAQWSIFDEPTANLDSDKKIKVYEMLKAYSGRKIVITHDLNLAYRLGYRVLYMDQGELLYDGESDIFFQPDHLQKFFGDSIRCVEGHFMVNYR